MMQIKWHDLPYVFEAGYSNAALLSGPYPYRIGLSDLIASRPSPIHWHDAFEIGYVLDGTGIFVLEDMEYPFGPGQVHVINDSYRHMAYTMASAQIFNVHFHPALLQDGTFHGMAGSALRPFIADSQQFVPFLPADNPQTQHIIRLLHAIKMEHERAEEGWMLVVKGQLLQIVGLLVRHFVGEPPSDPAVQQRQALLARIAPALRLIETRLAEPPTITELAAFVALSPSHFGALFRQAIGSTPVEYRNSRRIQLAQRLLLDGTEPVSAIAISCGFATTQQFNRTFRAIVGCTPSEYRVHVKHG
jgi:AraC-like DNA-binding protein